MTGLIVRYLPHIIVLMMICGGLAYTGYAIHENGKQVERAEWQAKELFRKKQESKLIDEANAKIKAEAEEQQAGLMEVINAQAKLTTKLERDIADLDGQRMYVSAKTECDGGGVSTKAEDTGQPGSRAGRVELPEALAREIRDDYFAAQRIANQYEACRQELMNIAEVIYE